MIPFSLFFFLILFNRDLYTERVKKLGSEFKHRSTKHQKMFNFKSLIYNQQSFLLQKTNPRFLQFSKFEYFINFQWF